ncbi:hydroxyacylglutathione hydrolase [Viridibacterium curvum]|uniref:Hydroxyacylglutathione hydrolase n=2 Tax=Viridibacterium curvum TaxID=1101404 RepID=A0ABP9R1L6_9RHOO
MEIVPLPALRDNYIWLQREGKECVVVDPGDPAPVRAYLAEHALELVGILVTHRHNDHIGGIPALLEDRPVPVYGPPSIAVVSHAVREGDTLQVPGAQLRVWAVPGHTEEHIAYLGEDFVFCGDTIFSAGCGRILGTASAAEFHASLTRLASLPGHTRLYCTHEYTLANLRFAAMVEPENAARAAYATRCTGLREQGLPTVPALLEAELAINPFLRTAEPAIQASVSQHAGQEMQSPPAVFAALRAWKDIA